MPDLVGAIVVNSNHVLHPLYTFPVRICSNSLQPLRMSFKDDPNFSGFFFGNYVQISLYSTKETQFQQNLYNASHETAKHKRNTTLRNTKPR